MSDIYVLLQARIVRWPLKQQARAESTVMLMTQVVLVHFDITLIALKSHKTKFTRVYENFSNKLPGNQMQFCTSGNVQNRQEEEQQVIFWGNEELCLRRALLV